MTTVATTVLLAYLVGSIPWSYVTGKIVAGVDLRRTGSGNLGASNAFRVLGARFGLVVLALDLLKGVAAPLWIARIRFGTPALTDPELQALCGVAAILGHVFPVYLGFRGGKGIATSAGVLLALEPRAWLLCFLAFALGFGVSRGIVSVASLLAALALPGALYAVGMWRGEVYWTRVVGGALLGGVIWIRHASNLGRIVHRKEPSIFDRTRRMAPEKRSSA